MNTNKTIFLNGLTTASFWSFQTHNTIFTNQCEKMSCPSCIQRPVSNQRPLEHELSPITTRPGLTPNPKETYALGSGCSTLGRADPTPENSSLNPKSQNDVIFSQIIFS